jgi:hypothetical protein
VTRKRPTPQATAWPDAARMAARSLTALFGGYLAAAGLATLLARTLPGSRVEASAWGMALAFLLFAVFGLWAFHERRLWVVALGLWGAALVSAAALYALGMRL